MRDEMLKSLYTLILIMIIISAAENKHHHRVKRKVLFTKNSKVFLRINGKENVLPWNGIFAHGWTFRVNWDLPETTILRQRFFKRDIHQDLESLHNMVEGYSCILKYACELTRNIKNSTSCGIFCGIGEIIRRSEGIDAQFFQRLLTKCNSHTDDCQYL